MRKNGTSRRKLFACGLIILCILGLCACKKAQNAAVESTPDFQQILDDAQRFMLEGNYEEAVFKYEAAIVIEPRNVHLLLDASKAYEAAGRYHEAAGKYQQAILLTPGSSSLYLEAARLYGQAGKNDQALAAIDDALDKIGPDSELLIEWYALRQKDAFATDWKTAYTRILMQWDELVSSSADYNYLNAMLIDFDFDGIPELCVLLDQIDSGHTTAFMLYRCEGSEAVQIPTDGILAGKLSLYREKSTGKFLYVAEANYAAPDEYDGEYLDRIPEPLDADCSWSTTQINVFSYENSLTLATRFSVDEIGFEEQPDAPVYFAQINRTDVSYEQYITESDVYYSGLVKQISRIKTLDDYFENNAYDMLASISAFFTGYLPYDFESTLRFSIEDPASVMSLYTRYLKDVIVLQHSIFPEAYSGSNKQVGMFPPYLIDVTGDGIAEMLVPYLEPSIEWTTSNSYRNIYCPGFEVYRVVDIGAVEPIGIVDSSVDCYEESVGIDFFNLNYAGKNYLCIYYDNRQDSAWRLEVFSITPEGLIEVLDLIRGNMTYSTVSASVLPEPLRSDSEYLAQIDIEDYTGGDGSYLLYSNDYIEYTDPAEAEQRRLSLYYESADLAVIDVLQYIGLTYFEEINRFGEFSSFGVYSSCVMTRLLSVQWGHNGDLSEWTNYAEDVSISLAQ